MSSDSRGNYNLVRLGKSSANGATNERMARCTGAFVHSFADSLTAAQAKRSLWPLGEPFEGR